MHWIFEQMVDHQAWFAGVTVVCAVIAGLCGLATFFAPILEQRTRPPDYFYIAWHAGGMTYFTDYQRHSWPQNQGESVVSVPPPTDPTILEIIQDGRNAEVVIFAPAEWEGVNVQITAPPYVSVESAQYFGNAIDENGGRGTGAYFNADIVGSEGRTLDKRTVIPIYPNERQDGGRYYHIKQLRWEDRGQKLFNAGIATVTESPDPRRPPEELHIQRVDYLPPMPPYQNDR